MSAPLHTNNNNQAFHNDTTTSNISWKDYIELGRQSFLRSNYDHSIKYYQHAIDILSNHANNNNLIPDLRCNIIACHLHQRGDALTMAQDLVNTHPKHVMARVRLAECHVQQGRSNDACNTLQSAMRILNNSQHQDTLKQDIRGLLTRELRRDAATSQDSYTPIGREYIIQELKESSESNTNVNSSNNAASPQSMTSTYFVLFFAIVVALLFFKPAGDELFNFSSSSSPKGHYGNDNAYTRYYNSQGQHTPVHNNNNDNDNDNNDFNYYAAHKKAVKEYIGYYRHESKNNKLRYIAIALVGLGLFNFVIKQVFGVDLMLHVNRYRSY